MRFLRASLEQPCSKRVITIKKVQGDHTGMTVTLTEYMDTYYNDTEACWSCARPTSRGTITSRGPSAWKSFSSSRPPITSDISNTPKSSEPRPSPPSRSSARSSNSRLTMFEAFTTSSSYASCRIFKGEESFPFHFLFIRSCRQVLRQTLLHLSQVFSDDPPDDLGRRIIGCKQPVRCEFL